MTTTTHTCDRCQQPAQEGRVRLALVLGTMSSLPIDLGSGKGALDLCSGCADELGKWLSVKAEAVTCLPN